MSGDSLSGHCISVWITPLMLKMTSLTTTYLASGLGLNCIFTTL